MNTVNFADKDCVEYKDGVEYEDCVEETKEDTIEDVLEMDNDPENNIDMISSQYKLMSFLNAMQNNNNLFNLCCDHNFDSKEEDNEIISKEDDNKILEKILDTNHLIYDETCSITINTEQIKDDIDDLKNKFDDLKNKFEELLILIQSK